MSSFQSIENAPMFLFLHLNWTKAKPSSFKIGDELTVENKEKYNDYKIVGRVYHYGGQNGGHYVYMRKNGENWYEISDSSVKGVSKIEGGKDIMVAYQFKASRIK